MRKPVDVADDVLDKVHSVMHLYRAQQYRVRRDEPDALTHMESKVLRFFARHPGATQSELSAHSGRDKGQLARLIAGLRERELLEARADAADRRSVHLFLSPAGEAADDALRRRARRLAAVAVKGFTSEEQELLAGLLDRVRANLERADDTA
ncbi:MAG: hypothetical protein JWP41_1153 [Ramlibacter sp.]|nr:hypothetical protein [Ramlibacter sp.]